MTAASSALGIATRPGEPLTGRASPLFLVGMALASLLTVLIGFGHSLHARASSASPPWAPLVILHGTAFVAWILLFLAQALLISTGRTALHRRMGVAGVALAVFMAGSGIQLAIDAARRGSLPGDPLAFLLIILVDLLSFASFTAAGIHFRRRADAHDRLMLLALTSLLPPAISRWPIAVHQPAVVAVVLLAFLVAAPACDRLSGRRVHPISLWGGVAIMMSVPMRFAMSRTDAWHRFAAWLVGARV